MEKNVMTQNEVIKYIETIKERLVRVSNYLSSRRPVRDSDKRAVERIRLRFKGVQKMFTSCVNSLGHNLNKFHPEEKVSGIFLDELVKFDGLSSLFEPGSIEDWRVLLDGYYKCLYNERMRPHMKNTGTLLNFVF